MATQLRSSAPPASPDFSGWNYKSGNTPDADILVHEVIDADWVRSLYGQPPYTPEEEAFIQHLLYSHTSIEQVGPVAEKAGVNTLVLSRLAPANNPIARWRRAKAGFSGRLVIGEDLLQLPVKR